MQPIDYRIDVKNPFEMAIGGIQTGINIGSLIDQHRKQQEEAALAGQMRADLSGMAADPTPKNILGMMAKYPAMADKLKHIYDTKSDVQKKEAISQALPIYSALESGNTEVATNMLTGQAAALRNSGREHEAASMDALIKQIGVGEHGINITRAQIGSFLAATMGPDEFGKVMNEARGAAKAPFEFTESKAKAERAVSEAAKSASEAKYAEDTAKATLDSKRWEIAAKKSGIAVENARLALSRAQDGREKEESAARLRDLSAKHHVFINDRKSGYEAATSQIDSAMLTIDGLLKTPLGVYRAATGPVDVRFPTMQRDVAGLEESISTLQSQVFLAQIPLMTGLGALSDAEGAALKSSIMSLSLRQPHEMLISNINGIKQKMLTAQRNLKAKYADVLAMDKTPPVERPQTGRPPTTDDILRDLGVIK